MSKDKETKQTEQEKVKPETNTQGNDVNGKAGSAGGDKVAEKETGVADPAEKLSAEAAQWREKYVRLSAEFDNYRKRTLKEKMDLVATAGEEVIKALLPVVDDLERALDAMENASDVESVKEGVMLISNKLRDTLRARGMAEIEALGKELDTDFHEAVAKIPAPDKKQEGRIVDVVQKGYKLNDKVIRHCKVVVGE